MKRAKNSYSEQSLVNISKSESVKAQKGDFEDYAKKIEKNLGKKGKRRMISLVMKSQVSRWREMGIFIIRIKRQFIRIQFKD